MKTKLLKRLRKHADKSFRVIDYGGEFASEIQGRMWVSPFREWATFSYGTTDELIEMCKYFKRNQIISYIAEKKKRIL